MTLGESAVVPVLGGTGTGAGTAAGGGALIGGGLGALVGSMLGGRGGWGVRWAKQEKTETQRRHRLP